MHDCFVYLLVFFPQEAPPGCLSPRQLIIM